MEKNLKDIFSLSHLCSHFTSIEEALDICLESWFCSSCSGSGVRMPEKEGIKKKTGGDVLKWTNKEKVRDHFYNCCHHNLVWYCWEQSDWSPQLHLCNFCQQKHTQMWPLLNVSKLFLTYRHWYSQINHIGMILQSTICISFEPLKYRFPKSERNV